MQRGRSKARYHADPARAIAYSLKYRAEHLPEVRARLRRWAKQKRESDPQYRLQIMIRKRTNHLLHHNLSIHTPDPFIDCTAGDFRRWLEAQFEEGMTWENYGKVWTVDHTKPLTAFDLTIAEQFLEACHYTNVRPMLAPKNIKKGGIRDHQARTAAAGRHPTSPAR